MTNEVFWHHGITLEEAEKRIVLYEYRFNEYNKTRTAGSLGIAIRTLDAKLDKYGVKPQTAERAEGKEIVEDPSSGLRVQPDEKATQKQQVSMRKR